MGLMFMIGASLLAFGPSLVMFVLTVCKEPYNIIVFIGSAFFWLVALLFSSILWKPISNPTYIAVGAIISVAFQELMRAAWWFIIRRAESGLLSALPGNSIARSCKIAYVSGLGYGVISGLMAMVNLLADASGPGVIGLYGHSQYFVLVSALFVSLMLLLHIFWGVVFFSALDQRRLLPLMLVVMSHVLVTSITLVNKSSMFGLSFSVVGLNTVLFAAAAIWVSREARNAITALQY